jgi:hypothetical protein
VHGGHDPRPFQRGIIGGLDVCRGLSPLGVPPSPNIIAKIVQFAAMTAATSPSARTNRNFYPWGRGEGRGRRAQASPRCKKGPQRPLRARSLSKYICSLVSSILSRVPPRTKPIFISPPGPIQACYWAGGHRRASAAVCRHSQKECTLIRATLYSAAT